MHSHGWWKRPAAQATLTKWCYRLLMYGVLLGLFLLAAGVATSERFHWAEPAAIAGTTDANSGGGNLVPVF
jgi:hypothetical protein